MSIYATCLSFDTDEHTAACARMRRLGPGDVMLMSGPDEFPIGVISDEGTFQLVDGPCTCGGDRHAPIVYRGSHVRPSLDDPRGGDFDLSTIPPHIAPLDEPNDVLDRRWDFLRVGFRSLPSPDGYMEGGEGTLLLDREQVIELRDWLTTWLGREVAW